MLEVESAKMPRPLICGEIVHRPARIAARIKSSTPERLLFLDAIRFPGKMGKFVAGECFTVLYRWCMAIASSSQGWR